MEDSIKIEDISEEWDVQCIMAAEFKKRRDKPSERAVWHYKVHWWGYSTDEESWEPEENLESSTDLVRRFWEEGVGSGEKKNRRIPGNKFKATKDWIEKEMKDFAQEMAKEENVDNALKLENIDKFSLGRTSSFRDHADVEKESKRRGSKDSGSSARADPLEKGFFDSVSSLTDEEQNTTSNGDGSAGSSQPARPKRTRAKRKLLVESDDDMEIDNEPLSEILSRKKKRSKKPRPLFASDDEGSQHHSPSPLFSRSPTSPRPDSTKTTQTTATKGTESLARPFSLRSETPGSLFGPSPPPASPIPKSPVVENSEKLTNAQTALSGAASSSTTTAPPVTVGNDQSSGTVTSPTGQSLPPLTKTQSNTAAEPSLVRIASALTKGVSKHRGSRIQIMSEPVMAQGNSTKNKLFARPDPLTVKKSASDNLKRKVVNIQFKKLSAGTNAPIATGHVFEQSMQNAPSTSVASPTRPESGSPSHASDSAASPTLSDSHKIGTPWLAGPTVQSPTHQTDDNPPPAEDVVMGEIDHPTVVAPSEAVSAAPLPDVPDVDSFLDTMIQEDPTIFGKLDWSGELSLSPNNRCTLQIGFQNVVDVDGPHRKFLVPLKALFQDIRCISVEKLFSCRDFLKLLRPAFLGPLQLAKVVATSLLDKAKVENFGHYLSDVDQVALIHLVSDTDWGNTKPRFYSVILFSANSVSLRSASEVPLDWKDDRSGSLVVALFRQRTKTPFEEHSERHPTSVEEPISISVWRKYANPLSNHVDRYAAAMLGITSSMVKNFRYTTYCMYPDEAQSRLDCWGGALFRFLTEVMKAKRVSVEDSTAKYIFVHATGLSQLDKLHKFRERKMFPQVSFYAYGQDLFNKIRLPPMIRPIYQVGGIFTFTARAVVENPHLVERLIAQANKDPFWDVYVLPSVVALVDELAAHEAGQPNEYGRVVHCCITSLSALLTSPEDGGPRITISFTPPSSTLFNDESSIWQWYKSQIDFMDMMDPIEILKRCRTILNHDHTPSVVRANKGRNTLNLSKKGPSIPPPVSGDADNDGTGGWGNMMLVDNEQQGRPARSISGLELWDEHASKEDRQALEDQVNSEVIRDMAAMQLQPALSTYRRFVVVTESTFDSRSAPSVEIVCSDKFSLTQRS
ncbi:hypothetical protein FRC03_000118 [Tulasnella sp. 419]|nr:hypothetical protein FRC03_000118 [Tulasnella sp. 419]